MEPPHDRGITRPAGNPHGDSEKPTRQRVVVPDRPCPAKENQKRGLEGILGVMRIVEFLPANVQNHGTMAFDQEGKGRFGVPPIGGQEPLEKLAI